MKRSIILIYLALTVGGAHAQLTKAKFTLVNTPEIKNSNHPQLCYLFFSPEILENEKVFRLIDVIAEKTPYTFVFLTARPSETPTAPPTEIEFHDVGKYHTILEKVVAYAHARGLKIGLQLWEDFRDVSIKDAERFIEEDEAQLDDNGVAELNCVARNVRLENSLMKSGLLRAYAFKKTGEGFYEAGSLRDITDKCIATPKGVNKIDVSIRAGVECKGLTVYLLSEYYYSAASSSTPEAVNRFVKTFSAYGDIPFDGIALDEFHNPLMNQKSIIRSRFYHPDMNPRYEALTGTPLLRGLLDMRYVPVGEDTVRIKAINAYMWMMRKLPLGPEKAVYNLGKRLYGKDTFIGIHNTFHNSLTNDEIWATGFNWWSVPRDYGQSDEETTLPIQMGIAMAHAKNAEYNQYYNKNGEHIAQKALEDLRYGVRTHFHALNDLHGWGTSLEKTEVYSLMEPVERCARLLNRFNPSLPEMHTLVIFGSEALSNWYPDYKLRSKMDIRDGLNIEEKVDTLLKAGYLTPVIPSDLIEEGVLKINAEGKPEMNGHKFESVIFLYPEYAHESVLKFLENYTRRGGKLMIEGAATHDFSGHNIEARFEALRTKATIVGFDVNRMGELGESPNITPGRCHNADGSFVFTDYASLDENKPAKVESITINGATYTFDYRGLAVIAGDNKGLIKFSARGVTHLQRNGVTLLRFKKSTVIELVRKAVGYNFTIEGNSTIVENTIVSPEKKGR